MRVGLHFRMPKLRGKTAGAVLILGCLGALLVSGARAGAISNSRDAYSLEFSSGWAIDRSERQFNVSHPDGSSFTGLTADLPSNVKSVKVAGMMLQATALAAGFCGNKTTTEFELSGPDWTGAGFHCNDQPVDQKPRSQTIGLTVKHGEAFYQFMLFVPRGPDVEPEPRKRGKDDDARLKSSSAAGPPMAHGISACWSHQGRKALSLA